MSTLKRQGYREVSRERGRRYIHVAARLSSPLVTA